MSEACAQVGARGGQSSRRRGWGEGRGLEGRRCPWCCHQPSTGVAHCEETAEFQRFLGRSSTAGSLMSALWTLGSRPGQLRQGQVDGAGCSYPTAGSLPSPGAGCVLHCLAASGACVRPGGRGWRSALVQLAHQWLGMLWMPHTRASRLGTFCACGDISVRPGTSRALGDGIAVPDGVECPRPEGHAPGRVECPRRWRESGGSGCPGREDAPEGSRSAPADAVLPSEVRFRQRAGSVVRAYGVAGGRQGTSATETWGSCPHTRNARGPVRCIPTRRTGRTSGADGDRHNTAPSKGRDWCSRPGKPGAPVTC